MTRPPTPADLFGRRRVVEPQAELTAHAWQRCAEMGVPVAAVHEILADPDETYPGSPTSWGTPTVVATSTAHPDWIVVHVPAQGREPACVVTVAWQTGRVPYRRTLDGSYELVDEPTREAVARWSW